MTEAGVAREVDRTTVTGEVLRSFAGTRDARLRQCLEVLTRHLHDAVRELEPTLAEWRAALDFLTATGETCDDVRQEFVLLSDVLGVSSLVESLTRRAPGATEPTVLGPFHQVASPPRALGDSLDELGQADRGLVSGRVVGIDGRPVAGAQVDVWQADEAGHYDVQEPDRQPPGNGRGLFTADGAGRFRFTTVVPSAYPIPTDGPVGRLLLATGRHPYRPAHIHFLVTAAGFAPLTTHLFVAGSPYLDSDAVFAVKASLVRDFARVDDPDTAAVHGLSNPYRHASIDLVLAPDEAGPRPG